MRKLLLPLNLLILLCLTSCIFKSLLIEDYLLLEDKYYLFNDFETLKAVSIPLINKSFKEWHWNNSKFDEKYDKYYDNISQDEYSLKLLAENDEYNYCVCVGNGGITTKEHFNVSGTYYLITEKKSKKSTVFFTN